MRLGAGGGLNEMKSLGKRFHLGLAKASTGKKTFVSRDKLRSKLIRNRPHALLGPNGGRLMRNLQTYGQRVVKVPAPGHSF